MSAYNGSILNDDLLPQLTAKYRLLPLDLQAKLTFQDYLRVAETLGYNIKEASNDNSKH